MFNKRHYIAIAGTLREGRYRADPTSERDDEIWVGTLRDFTRLFANDNPNFDCDRFLLACSPTVADRDLVLPGATGEPGSVLGADTRGGPAMAYGYGGGHKFDRKLGR